MKLDTALEIGDALLFDGPQFPPEDRRTAMFLLVHAGKRVLEARRDPVSVFGRLLLNETEE